MQVFQEAPVALIVAIAAICWYVFRRIEVRECMWQVLAFIVSRPRIATWLIERSKRTPYYPITSRDGSETYMHRWWLFNAYSKDDEGNAGPPRWSWLPSVRVHHILRADDDDHMHDHPWDARTVLLRGWYEEERGFRDPWTFSPKGMAVMRWFPDELFPRDVFDRVSGDTQSVLFNQYHRISEVAPGGVYTLWFTWKYQDTWGFLVNGKKVPWRDYLAGRPRT